MRKAPTFSLVNQDDREVSLNSLQEKWVILYFYPKDNTPGCTTQACDFSSFFPLQNTHILGISPDSTASHRNFIEKQQLKSHLQNYLGCFLGLFPPRFGLVLANHAWLAANSALCEAKKSLRKPLQLILQVALKIELLSDPEKEVMKAYDAWGEKKNYGKVYEGVIRSTFIIDPKGLIAAEWKNVRAKGHAEKVLKKLKELQDGQFS